MQHKLTKCINFMNTVNEPAIYIVITIVTNYTYSKPWIIHTILFKSNIAFRVHSIDWITLPTTNVPVCLCTMWHMVGWFTIVTLPHWFNEQDANTITSSQDWIYFLKTQEGDVIFVN